jgi:hypothetical protein
MSLSGLFNSVERAVSPNEYVDNPIISNIKSQTSLLSQTYIT